LKKTVLLNVPYLFNSIWNLISGWLNEEVRSKYVFLGGPDEYEPYLKQLFSSENIPICFGGTLDYKFQPGGLLTNLNIPTAIKKNWSKICVLPRTSWNNEIHVKECTKGTIIWEFRTEGYDIGFGLFYKESDNSNEKILIEISRVKSHQIIINGNYTFDQKGIYVMRFDNLYSVWNSKNLEYIISVVQNIVI